MQNKENNTGVSAIGSSILHPFSNTATSWRISLSSFVRTPLFSCQLHSILSLFFWEFLSALLGHWSFFSEKDWLWQGTSRSFLCQLSLPWQFFTDLDQDECWLLFSVKIEMLGGKSNMVGTGIQAGSLGCLGIVRGQRAGKEWCLQDGKDNRQDMINLLLEGTESYWNC